MNIDRREFLGETAWMGLATMVAELPAHDLEIEFDISLQPNAVTTDEP